MIIFNGKQLAQEILFTLQEKTALWPKKPRLAVVSFGAEQSAFIKQKEKAARMLDFGFKQYNFKESISAHQARQELNKIVKAKNNTAIVVQLPLPPHINIKILNVIPAEKDPDLLCEKSVGMFFNGTALLEPPTAGAIIKILESAGIDLKNKSVVLFGWGKLIGRFLVSMLLRKGAAISIIEKDIDLVIAKNYALSADIIISACGQPNFIAADMVKNQAIIIDAGFSTVDGIITGDVDFEAVQKKVSFITPVPGGVGPVGVAMLFQNITALYESQQQ
jgi:methylenetetrahydrofolate dehydrogenase (NADP+) / methenyltetrahydrofolate cyclohydrolase